MLAVGVVVAIRHTMFRDTLQRKSERVVRFGENGQKPAKGDYPAKLFSKVLLISAHGSTTIQRRDIRYNF